MTKHFDTPVLLTDGRSLASLDDAIAALSDTGWPERGPRHDEALDICLKVRDGHRSLSEGRMALEMAAQEAGNLQP
jgi:hypothetical protein